MVSGVTDGFQKSYCLEIETTSLSQVMADTKTVWKQFVFSVEKVQADMSFHPRNINPFQLIIILSWWPVVGGVVGPYFMQASASSIHSMIDEWLLTMAGCDARTTASSHSIAADVF